MLCFNPHNKKILPWTGSNLVPRVLNMVMAEIKFHSSTTKSSIGIICKHNLEKIVFYFVIFFFLKKVLF